MRSIAVLSLLASLWLGPVVLAQDNTIPKTAEESLDRLEALILKHQRPGTDHSPNGYDALIDAIEAVRDADYSTWRANDGHLYAKEGMEPPCFDCIYNESTDPAMVKATQSAKEILQAYEKAGVFELTARFSGAMRAARPRPGTDASRRLLRVCDSKDDAWDGRLVLIMLPELGKTRALARIEMARMHLAAKAGDTKTVAASFEEVLALARIAGHQTTVIDRLVAIAMVSLATNEARDVILSGLATEPVLAGFSGAIDRQLPLPSPRAAVDGERLVVLDTLRWLAKDGAIDMAAIAELTAVSSKPVADYTKLGGKLATPAETAASTNKMYDALAKLAETPRRERAALGIDPAKLIDDLPPGEIVLRLMAPAIGRSLDGEDQTVAQLAGLRAMIALERHRLTHGTYPDSLAALGPEVAAQIQDPLGQGVLCYKVIDAKTTTGAKAYTLYTVGVDGEDNGGKPAPNVYDALYKPAEGKGFDFILSLPDGGGAK